MVGKLRREGCQRPSGYWSCGAAMPQRGCSSAKDASDAIAPGATSMSEFEAITYGALVAATPRLMFAPKPSVRSLAITSAPWLEGEPPGLTVSTSSSTCGARESRQGCGSGSPGVQITIAATLTVGR